MIEARRASAGVVAHRIGQQWKAFVSIILWITLVFAGAGRLDWARGWACVAIYIGSMLATGVIVHHTNHGLLERRATWQRKDTKLFDKIFVWTFLPLTGVQPAVAGLDVVRFRWSAMPWWTIFPATGIFLAGMALVTWTLSVNPYAENSVRIQSERGHRVIRSGPYRWVRHPMYVGSILMYPATGWMFGSLVALGIGMVMAALFVVRTALEDRTLRSELQGYLEYSQATRYRLLPGIW